MPMNNATGPKQEAIQKIIKGRKDKGKTPPKVTATTAFAKNGPDATAGGMTIHVHLHGFHGPNNPGTDGQE